MRRLAVLALLAGCHHDQRSAAGPGSVPLTAEAPEADAVVATVDGRPIRASEIALQATARGTDARHALADLIDAEVLAGEAARRGLESDPAAREAARATSVRRLLAIGFEKDVGPEQIPERQVRSKYELKRNELDHSEYVDVWHILTKVPKGAAPAVRAAARANAEELARRARTVDDADEFQALAKDQPPPDGTSYEVDRIVTAYDGWTVPQFSRAAFEQLKNPGDKSSVVETEFGFHVMFLNRRIPAAHVPFAEAAPKLRAALFPDFQRREFARFIDAEVGKHAVQIHYDRIP